MLTATSAPWVVMALATALGALVLFLLKRKLTLEIQEHVSTLAKKIHESDKQHTRELQEHSQAFTTQLAAVRSELAKDVARDERRYEAAITACQFHDDLLEAFSERSWAGVVLGTEVGRLVMAEETEEADLAKFVEAEKAAELELARAEKAVDERVDQLRRCIRRSHLQLSTAAQTALAKTLETLESGWDDDWRAERRQDVRATLKAEFHPEPAPVRSRAR